MYGSKGSSCRKSHVTRCPGSPLPDQTPQALSIVLNFAAHQSIFLIVSLISQGVYFAMKLGDIFYQYYIYRCQNKRMSFRLYLISRGT